MTEQILFPNIEIREKGFLQVSDIHSIYWERSGNPEGKKILVLHGGPGGGSQPRYRRYFNPEKFDIIQFDQRGCGASTPFSELKENTTNDLVNDIEKLRIKLKIIVAIVGILILDHTICMTRPFNLIQQKLEKN